MSLATRFLPAFLATLDNFAERDYFAQVAPDRCPDGHEYFWTPAAVRKALVMQLGLAAWPLTDADAAGMQDEQVIEYVEAFFQLVAKPTESWFHDYCRSSHPTKFDTAAGRYDYTVSVNALLDRFGTGLRLQNGKIRSSGSQVMAPRLTEALPFGGDDHLRGLVTMALDRLPVRRPSEALERCGTWLMRTSASSRLQVPGNKKQSVAALVSALRPEAALAEHLDALLREMTGLSNDLTIRHHEIGTVEITEDADLIDFLFYSYYNLIRFALLRLYAGQAEAGPGQSAEGRSPLAPAVELCKRGRSAVSAGDSPAIVSSAFNRVGRAAHSQDDDLRAERPEVARAPAGQW